MADTAYSFPGPQSVIRQELPNGMTVLVYESPSSASVSVSGQLQVGAADDPPGSPGVSYLVARCLMRGTTRHTFQQVSETLESIGASVSVGGGRNSTGFGAQLLAEDFRQVVDILADILQNPTFPENEVKKVRGEILTTLHECVHDTAWRAAIAFRELLYGPDHPYGRSILGDPESVTTIAREALEDFYCTRFGPQGAIIAIVGALDAHDSLKVWENAFGTWTGITRVGRASVSPPPRPTVIRQARMAIKGATQADLMLGFVGPSHDQPDYLDALVCNSVLGVFGMMGRLGTVVRDRHGLAYYCYSDLEGGLGPGPWAVRAGVDALNVDSAVKAIVDEIARIRAAAISSKELSDNKAYITGSLPLALETNAGIARALVNIELFDLGLDYLQRYEGLIEDVSPTRVQAVAQRYLDPGAYALAVAGPE